MARNDEEDRVSRFLSCFTIFFTIFFGGSFILGHINLATDLPVVNPFYGSSIIFVGFLLWVWFSKSTLIIAKPGVNSCWLSKQSLQIALPGTGLSRKLAIITIIVFILVSYRYCDYA